MRFKPVTRLTALYYVLRHFGPGWLAFRLTYLAKLKVGLIEHKTPKAGWEAYRREDIFTGASRVSPEAYI